MQSLIIKRPDDWHVHFRDGIYLQHTVQATARYFARALVMPNLKPALTTIDSINAYRERILSINTPNAFTPYFTFYLNETVKAIEIEQSKKYDYILGAKLYPAGATTNSEAGARSLQAVYPLLEVMQEQNLVLQIHGETTQGDIFCREAEFIKTHLSALVKNFPKLRIVLEHISTKTAVDFVLEAPRTIAATITPQHLLYNRNQLLAGGIRPHYYCLPILKSETDQQALRKAAVSGNKKFFAGTDSAPHARSTKETACGCAGIYSAPYAIALYAQVFDEMNELHKLEAFLSHFGAHFYQLSINNSEIILKKEPQLIPKQLPFGQEEIIPIAAGDYLPWSIYDHAR